MLERNQEALQQLQPKAQFAQVEAVDMGKGRLARQHWQITYRVTRQIQRLRAGCSSPRRPGCGFFQPQPWLYASTPATQKPFSRLTAKQRVGAGRFTLDPGIDAIGEGLMLRLQAIDPFQQAGDSVFVLAQTGHERTCKLAVPGQEAGQAAGAVSAGPHVQVHPSGRVFTQVLTGLHRGARFNPGPVQQQAPPEPWMAGKQLVGQGLE